jgi:hypothetical protein
MWNNAVSVLQTFFSNPVVGIILTILLLVAGYKITAFGANWLLLVAWAIGVVYVFLLGRFHSRNYFPEFYGLASLPLDLGFLFIMYFGRARPSRPHRCRRATSNCDQVIGICKRRCQ